MAGAGAQQGQCLIQQGGVVGRPHHFGGVGRPIAMKQIGFIGGEQRPGGGAEQCRRAEQVVEKVGRGEHRPHPLQGLTQLDAAVETLAHRLDVKVGTVGAECTLGQTLVHLLFHESASSIVGAEPSAGLVHDLFALLDGEPETAKAIARHHVGPQRPLTIPEGSAQNRDHAQIALDAGRRRIVQPLDPGTGQQIGQHRHFNTGLAQRWQHLLDVGEEQAVGAEHQHSLAFERETVGVEQIGGSVEGCHRLAGAGTALHHQHAGQRRADDGVLLGLDGGSGVGEAAGARRL